MDQCRRCQRRTHSSIKTIHISSHNKVSPAPNGKAGPGHEASVVEHEDHEDHAAVIVIIIILAVDLILTDPAAAVATVLRVEADSQTIVDTTTGTTVHAATREVVAEVQAVTTSVLRVRRAAMPATIAGVPRIGARTPVTLVTPGIQETSARAAETLVTAETIGRAVVTADVRRLREGPQIYNFTYRARSDSTGR